MIVLKAVMQFFLFAVIGIFAQNAVFTRALGVSRLVKLVDDDTTDSIIFGVLICAVQLVAAPLGYLANRLMAPVAMRSVLRPLVLTVCTVVAFFLVLAVLALAAKKRGRAKSPVVDALPMATFNCAVLGTLLITTTQGFGFGQTMGFALGSGVGYFLAVMVVVEAQNRLDHDDVPTIFKGLPITLVYIGIVALAIYGFTGHMISF